jgi:protein-L-isoaspartate(D-aspartate) O-methyltransferase
MGYSRLALLSLLICAMPAAADEYASARDAMVRAIEADVRATAGWLQRDRLDPRVRDALATVPRHRLVPEPLRASAYANRPLPIGHGQTISQPYIVAIMTELLAVEPGDKVFELGTGSGYQAAILAEMGVDVYTMEIIPPLGELARERLSELGYDSVSVRIGDGYFGRPEQAPFDAIVVTAAGDHIPPPLVAQLAPGGRMVIPVGSPFLTQQLVLVEKLADGGIRTRDLLPVRFVPLTGEH